MPESHSRRAGRTAHGARLQLFLIVLLFCAGLYPLARDYLFDHVDEHLYTDAAIQMVQSGNWLTPLDSSGRPRFQKPILTYWMVASSYQLFGISTLSSRLPSLAFAAGALLLTYALGVRVARSRNVALLATLIVASNPLFILAALRSNPDIFLCFLLLWSSYCFADVLFERDPSKSSVWYAHLAAGLAILTKGLPAIAFLLYVWLFASLTQPQVWKSRRMAGVGVLAGGGLPLLWFAGMYAAYGDAFIRAIWIDQVQDKVSPGLLATPASILAFVGQYALFFMPWSLLLPLTVAGKARRTPKEGWAARDSFEMFVLCWAALLAVMFGFGRTLNGHYLLPACPLIAVCIARRVYETDSATMRAALHYGSSIAIGVLVVISLVVFSQGTTGWAFVSVAAGLAALLTIAIHRGDAWPVEVLADRMAIVLFIFFPVAGILIGVWALPDLGHEVTGRLRALGVKVEQPVLFVGPDMLAGQIRVCSGGRRRVLQSPRLPTTGLDDASIVVAPIEAQQVLEQQGYETSTGGGVVEKVPVLDVIRAGFRLRLIDFMESVKQRYVIAIRNAKRAAAY